jgi:hypothetical protein
VTRLRGARPFEPFAPVIRELRAGEAEDRQRANPGLEARHIRSGERRDRRRTDELDPAESRIPPIAWRIRLKPDPTYVTPDST